MKVTNTRRVPVVSPRHTATAVHALLNNRPISADRMTRLGTAISEAVIAAHGAPELLARLGDPFWFQALGSVMGMDWHSSGITTSVMGALKRGLNPRAHELGVYVCGGRGRHSRRTPTELCEVVGKTGLDVNGLPFLRRHKPRDRVL